MEDPTVVPATVPAWVVGVVAVLGPALTAAGAWLLNYMDKRRAFDAAREQTSFTHLHQIIEDLRESASEQERRFQTKLTQVEEWANVEIRNLRSDVRAEAEARHDCQKRLTRAEAHIFMLEDACRRANPSITFRSWDEVARMMTEGSDLHRPLGTADRRTGETQDTGQRRRTEDAGQGRVERYGPNQESEADEAGGQDKEGDQ